MVYPLPTLTTLTKLPTSTRMGCWLVVGCRERARGEGMVVVKAELEVGARVRGYYWGNVSRAL